MKITWIYNKKENPLTLKGFSFTENKEIFEYKGDEIILLKLKESFSQFVFHHRLQDQYEV